MKKKLAIALVPVLVATIAILIALERAGDRLHATARREWKAKAIAGIDKRFGDSNWLGRETRTLKAKATNAEPDWDSWVSPYLLLMKNSEWIVYDSKCSKEDPRIHDIFIGRGSDGNWYYSCPGGHPQFMAGKFMPLPIMPLPNHLRCGRAMAWWARAWIQEIAQLSKTNWPRENAQNTKGD